MKYAPFAATLAVAALASGCAWWHNFSTYFNTVYLANRHVEAYEAEQRAVVPQNQNPSAAVLNHRWLDEEYLMRQQGLRSGTAEPITPSFSQSLSATKEVKNMHLDSAVILGSKVLADKKENKYKEDALFIVGKAQFYQNDFIGAERKFHELLAHYPDTKYGVESRVFLARAMLLNHHVDTAGLQLQRELSHTANDPAAASSLHRAMAELIYAQNPDSLSGIANELHLSEQGVSGEDLARLAYQEGAVYYLNGDWLNTERAFQLAASTSSDDWLIGESLVADALAKREAGKLDQAKLELQDVLSHVKYSGSQAAARYELAFTDELIARAAVAGDLRSPEFRTQYYGPLHAEYFQLDTMFRNTSALIISRAKFRQAEMYRGMGYYDSAAKTAAPLIGTKDFSSLAMNEYVTSRASSLASYAEWRKELTHIDSLESKLAAQKKVRTYTSTAALGNPEQRIHLQALQEVLGSRWMPQRPVDLTKEDSVRLKEVEAQLQSKETHVAIADTNHFIDSLKFRAATAHYQLGRAYETFGEIPESRTEYAWADTMDVGPLDTGRTALRAQNLYAWLQLEHQEKNKPVQDSLLSELISKYGQTIYAQEARILFGNNDKNSPGELAYSSAYKTLRESGLEGAKLKFLAVVSQYSQEDVAPRALYAIGESYEEAPRYDSAAAYYKRILQDYPYSMYALALRPRFAEASPQQVAPANAPHTLAPNRRELNNPREVNPAEQRQEVPQQTPGMPPNAPNRPGGPFGRPGLRPPPLPPGVPQPPGAPMPGVPPTQPGAPEPPH